MEIKPEKPFVPLTVLLLVPVVLFAIFTTRNRLHSVRSNPPANLAMPVVRTYGLGLSAPTFVRPVVSSQEAWLYRDDIRAVFLAEKFADLEKIAQTNRDDPTFLAGGVWKNHEFFGAIVPTSYRPITDADYESYIEKAKRWQRAFPESSAARISLAWLYLSYAYFRSRNRVCQFRSRSTVAPVLRTYGDCPANPSRCRATERA